MPKRYSLESPCPKPPHAILYNSWTVLSAAHKSASAFLAHFQNIRAQKKSAGTSTDTEQDLLRAMLLTACSGLDSMVKHLVKDSLAVVVRGQPGAHQMLISFIEKKLKRSEAADLKTLAEALAAARPGDSFLNLMIAELRENSLQSKHQLLSVAAHFDIPSAALTKELNRLDTVFRIRNQITHELDIDFSKGNRSRIQRKTEEMTEHANFIFRVAKSFLTQVQERIVGSVGSEVHTDT